MKDWGEISELFEEIEKNALNRNLQNDSEAQTRFDIIDRVIKEVLQWSHGQINVEPHTSGVRKGYIDYELKASSNKIIIEAKQVGAAFPMPSQKKSLKLTGKVLGQGEISKALIQAEEYAINRSADLVMVTNGHCWCFYPMEGKAREEIYATLLFPFINPKDAEILFSIFCVYNVENGSLSSISSDQPIQINKLLTIVDDGNYRIGRNNIADHIAPAIDNAILSEALLENIEVLKHCYVITDSRVKFDTTLNMHLAQYKPSFVQPAKKIKRGKEKNELAQQIANYSTNISYPVTLLIGSVGSGKSTYLKYFEKIKGKDVLATQKAHWIYIDFEKLGGKNPRKFIYDSLNEYLLEEHPNTPTDYKNLIMPAYEERIKALARGPLSMMFTKNKDGFDAKIQEMIIKDYENVEPYVERVYKYLAMTQLCVIVIDNVDLYENEVLETEVFSEAISLSKKIKSNIIVSIRDTTFIKHKDDSIFNAHELKKLWINPPSFREVLSRRLKYAQLILKDKPATIPTKNGTVNIKIDDLSIFFNITQASLLNEENGRLLEYLSDRNPRKGITLIQNFFLSGHIQADQAIKNYLSGDTRFKFPYHEIFKGAMLGQYKYYKEQRSEACNLYDSSLGARQLQLVRLYILKLLHNNAKLGTPETSKQKIIDIISCLGISDDLIMEVISILKKYSLIQSNNESALTPLYYITLCGGYYITNLAHRMVYLEATMFDVNIFDSRLFQKLSDLTINIENTRGLYKRMVLRKQRMLIFMQYLITSEEQALSNPKLKELESLGDIKTKVEREFTDAVRKTKAKYGVS